MRIDATKHSGIARLRQAMTLMELLVAMGILSIIVVGLLAMFQQTQRALRASATQTDVLETWRAVMDLMVREIQQAAAINLPHYNNNFYDFSISNSVNFFGITNSSNGQFPPLSQKRSGGAPNQDYDFEDIFFVIHDGNEWRGIGYFINLTNNAGYGTLYRFLSIETNWNYATNLYIDFLNEKSDFQNNPTLIGTYKTRRVADGIVHLEAHFYNEEGFMYPNIIATNLIKFDNFAVFMGNLLPYTVEIQLGVLEPPLLDRVRGMPGGAARAFLEDEHRAGRVHLFRQLIQVRSAGN